jgi:hypothetical protein
LRCYGRESNFLYTSKSGEKMDKKDVSKSVSILKEIVNFNSENFNFELPENRDLANFVSLGKGKTFTSSFPSYHLRRTSELMINKYSGVVEVEKTKQTRHIISPLYRNQNHIGLDGFVLPSIKSRVVPESEFETKVLQYNLNPQFLRATRDHIIRNYVLTRTHN